MSTQNIGLRLRQLREQLGLSQNRFAKLAGIPQPKISRWESGKEAPSAKYLLKLARALGVPVEALLLGEGVETRDGQAIVRLPVAVKVRAGEAVPPTILDSETIEVTLDMAQKADAVVEVKGDSMEPELHEGDLCGVRWQDYATHGQFVVAQIDDFDDLTIKRYVQKPDHFILEPLNKKYPSYPSKRHRIRILGKITWVLRWYERP
ncbi:MAG: hypothetical protein SLRJCFUN_002455 [Candidatus Fervidibacter sp.]|jgi:repressor LexA